MEHWSSFCQGELGAAAALAGLLFVSVSMNQARILELPRMADRGLEALAILFLVIVATSLALVPGQPPRVLGVELLIATALCLGATIPLQRLYRAATNDEHRRSSTRMIWLNRMSISLVGVTGAALLASGDARGLYVLPAGVLLCFGAVGVNAWVLLVEINR